MNLKKPLISLLSAGIIAFSGCSNQIFQEDMPKWYKENPEIWSQIQKGQKTRNFRRNT